MTAQSRSRALKELGGLNGFLSITRVSFHSRKRNKFYLIPFRHWRPRIRRSTYVHHIFPFLSLANIFTAGGTPDRIGGAWQLRRISSVVVNGDTSKVETLYQRDTHKGIILSAPLQLTLNKGSKNTITVRGLYNGVDYKGADLDRIIVYPPED